MKLQCIEDLRFRIKRIENLFDMKTEEGKKRKVGRTNIMTFERSIEASLPPANELVFLTIGDNKNFSEEIFKKVQKIFNQSKRIIAQEGTNQQMNDLVQKEAREILDLIYIIENNDQEFKLSVIKGKTPFDEHLFLDVAKKIHIKNKNPEEKIKLFHEELDGGEILMRFSQKLGIDQQELSLYGIDRDIDVGISSRERGINTARRGLLSTSDDWVDIAISSNHEINFQMEEKSSQFLLDLYRFETTLNRRVLKRGGVIIFNAPYYKMDDVKKSIRNLGVLDILNSGDKYGNLIFIVENRLTTVNSRNKELLLNRAQYMPHTLPTVESMNPIKLELEATEPPMTFRASFVDLDDLKQEFEGVESSSEFIFDHFEVKDRINISGRPLEEPKEGHIPTLTASGVMSGRYIDEILEKKIGKKLGFDNLIEGKIIKREIEESQRVHHNGQMVEEVSLKKSNIIIFTALTSQGEFIELFSNETE